MNSTPVSPTKLERRFIRLFKCDTAEVERHGDKLFLVIGHNRNTKDDTDGQWMKNGAPYDFDYVARKVIASGKTEEELIKSARHYKWLCGLTWEKFLKRVAAGKAKLSDILQP